MDSPSNQAVVSNSQNIELPAYDFYMLPLLELTSDGQIWTLQDANRVLAQRLALSPQALKQLLPSGQSAFHNRMGWAKTYLSKAGLLLSPKKGQFQISQRGRDLLAEKLEKIDKFVLRRFPEFREFSTRAITPKTESTSSSVSLAEKEQTPEERLIESYQQLRENLADELLATIKQCSPEFFEQLVVDLLVSMGYGGSRKDAGERIGQSGDGGIDGVIKEDRLGLDAIYIQAKRWEGTVGRPVVQAFAGSLEGFRARKGVLLTTSDFSSQAREYVERIEKKIILVDGKMLTELMIDYNIGVSVVEHFVIKRMDSDYFEA